MSRFLWFTVYYPNEPMNMTTMNNYLKK